MKFFNSSCKKNLLEITKNFKDKKIIVIGDLILDHFIYGNSVRISPEAPVPVVKLENEIYTLGGAANVAANISSLEGKVTLFGSIGKNFAGEKFKEIIKKENIHFIPFYNKKTTQKTRIISNGQQITRIDDEEIAPKKINLKEHYEMIKNSDLIVISDYAKGVVNSSLINYLRATGKRIIADPKPKNMNSYKDIYLITPNKEESIQMISQNLDYNSLKDIHYAGKKLTEDLNTNIIITRGKEGMSIFNKGVHDIPTKAKKIFDITGAGDTVISAIALSLASSANLNQSAEIANYAAGIVIAKPGTAKVTLKELQSSIYNQK